MKIETIAVHSGTKVDPATGAVAPPIHLATTFARDAEGNYPHGYVYSRSHNPTRDALEKALTALEGGVDAAAFASGIAATATIFQALNPGDHVIAAADTYHGTGKLLRDVFVRWGLEVSFVEMDKISEVRAAVRPATRLLSIETPSNPLLKITDIRAVAEVARAAGALCVCDNTWSPIVQRPLELGADLVVHSTTKYLGGHSDVTGGAVIAREATDFFRRIRDLQSTVGAVPSPFDCWLVARGIRTVPWRMRAHSENALHVAQALAAHPAVEAVHYPGLPSDRGHEIAARQMSAFGGMISVEIKGGREPALRAAGRLKLFTRATSLGGVESLIEHRASVAGEDPRTPAGLLRISVGLENAADLVDDLEQALA